MNDYYKYKQHEGVKFKSFKKLWSKAWYDKRRTLFLIYENTKPNEDKFHIWMVSNLDQCAILFKKRLNPKTSSTDKRKFRSLLKKQTYVISPSVSINKVIEDMGYEVDYENHEDSKINFRSKEVDQVKEVIKPKKIEKISESQWIRARDYQ